VNRRSAAICIFLLTWLAFALAPPESSNVQIVTRLGLTISILNGRLDIDHFADKTVDKAFFGGHYYSDKVPGLSFLAVPVVAATALIVRELKDPAAKGEYFAHFARAATTGVNGFFSALAVTLLFLTTLRLGATRGGALLAAGALAFATPFFGWSTVFFAHSVSGSFLLFAATGIAFAFSNDNSANSLAAPFLFGLGLGLLLGYTLVIDLTAAPACMVAGGLVLILTANQGVAKLTKVACGLLLGGLLGLLPLLVYNTLIFGSPLTIGYSKVVGFEGMQQGFFGLSWPRADVAAEILFGFYRGLLPLSPILILVPFGLTVMWRKSTDTRIAAAAIVAVLCSFIWINASYYYWDGGASTGPRHLVPMLPVVCLALAFAWPRPGGARAVVLTLLAASLVLSLMCVMGSMFAPEKPMNTIVDFLLPDVLKVKNLIKSLPIISVWVLFALIFLRWERSTLQEVG
jgi:hypothetical protein